MISVIICSVDPKRLELVKDNIKSTIGVEHEIVAIDNSANPRGICQVYNEGALQSKYDVLCFMHEDIFYHTNHWGESVIKTFKEERNLGVLGIAGSRYKALTPSSWHCYGIDDQASLNFNIIQNYKYSDKEKSIDCSNPQNAKFQSVACIDGVWFCCTRAAFDYYQFDEIKLTSFHGYDIDFCLGVGEKFSVGVTFEILIEHFSEGNFSKFWLGEILKVHKKWSHKLPVNLAELEKEEMLTGEKQAFKSLLKRMREENFLPKEMFLTIFNSRKSRIMTLTLLFKLYFACFKIVSKRN